MTDSTTVDEAFGPQLDLTEFRLPDALAGRLGDLYGTEPPTTGREWVEEMRAVKQELDGEPPTVDDLCTSTDGAHTFVGDARAQSYVCVLDPLVVPFLTGEPGTVRSTTPERGARVELTVDGEGLSVSHPDAVFSLGAADAIDADAEPTMEAVYGQLCPYIHVFADEAEYGTWATDADAATTSVPAREGVAIAREFATSLFGPS